MKKIAFVAFVLLAFSFCIPSFADSTPSPQPVSQYSGVCNAATSEKIYLGMDYSSAKKILGPEIKSEKFTLSDKYKGDISILMSGANVCWIELTLGDGANVPPAYSTLFGAYCGMTADSLQNIIGFELMWHKQENGISKTTVQAFTEINGAYPMYDTSRNMDYFYMYYGRIAMDNGMFESIEQFKKAADNNDQKFLDLMNMHGITIDFEKDDSSNIITKIDMRQF